MALCEWTSTFFWYVKEDAGRDVMFLHTILWDVQKVTTKVQHQMFRFTLRVLVSFVRHRDKVF